MPCNYSQCGDCISLWQDWRLSLWDNMVTCGMYILYSNFFTVPTEKNIQNITQRICYQIVKIMYRDDVSISNDQNQVSSIKRPKKVQFSFIPTGIVFVHVQRFVWDMFSWICTLGFPWNESRLFSKAKQSNQSQQVLAVWPRIPGLRAALTTASNHRGPTGCQVWWLLWISHCKLQHA